MSKKLHRVKKIGVMGMEKREKTVKLLTEAGIELADKAQGKRVERLKKRAERCVCRYCGGKLGLRKITYSVYDEAKIEIFCNSCGRIEYGTEQLIYKMAEYYTETFAIDYYPELDESANKERMNKAVLSDIMGWGFKNAGLLADDGFSVPLTVDEDLLGEATILSETELKQAEKG